MSLIIGKKIKARRVELCYSQNFMAICLNTSQNTISYIENGKSSLTIETLLEIAHILKVDLDYFLTHDVIDHKSIRIKNLEDLTIKLEKRNKILEDYILKFIKQ